MSKVKKRPIIESDGDDSDASDLEQELRSLASAAKRPKPAPVSTTMSSDSDSSSCSDDEWTLDGKGGKKSKGKVKGKGGKGGGGSRIPGKRMVTQKKPVSPSSSDSSGDGDLGKGFQAGSHSGSSSSSSSSSDSDSSSDESLKFDDGLDFNLVGDQEDREKLALMTEAEREQEMYNRFEKRQALKARFEIERKLRREKKVGKRRQKEKGGKRRRGARTRPEDKTKSRAIDELKAKRSADKMRKAEAEKQQVVQSQPLKASDVFSSGSDDESSSSSSSGSDQADSEDEAGGRSLSGLRASAPKYISTLDEINKIKLSRFRLEKWVHMPFLADVVKGCFVRVGIGAHEGRMVYRICEVVGVHEIPKVYSLGSTRTNKGLRLRHGMQERTFRMEYVSNSPFTDSEFSKWKEELEKRDLPLPTVDHVKRKSKEIDKSKNFEFKDEDIDKIIQEKQKFTKNPRNYAMTKSRMLREKEQAEQEGNADRVSALVTQLDELEERAELLDKQRTKGLSAITYINERNRQRNVIRAEQALKEEMAASDKGKEDPFTRRKCQPTLVSITRDTAPPGTAELLHKLSQAKTEEDKEAIMAAAKQNVPALLSPTSPNGQELPLAAAWKTPEAGATTATPIPLKLDKKQDVDDLFTAHDFDIQIDLPTEPDGPSAVKAVPKAAPTPKSDGPRRSLNLADYKKRRGLI